MKDYKLLLIGLLLLLLLILIGILSWMWLQNRKNVDPLPIIANTDTSADALQARADEDTTTAKTLYLQADKRLQVPLDAVIVRFEARYPNIQVLARYVPEQQLLKLPDARVDMAGRQLAANDDEPFVATIDILIADSALPAERLAPLQTKLNKAQTVINNNRINANGMMQEPDRSDKNAPQSDNSEARTLNSFGYAIKDQDTVEGVILTDNPLAISFRNFLLSSSGQDTLKQYDYYNIDGYKNSVDDLFNPTSRAKLAANEDEVKMMDVLDEGR